MVAHGDEIGVQRSGLRRAGGRAVDHAQDVGGMTEGRIGRNGRLSRAQAQHHGSEYRRGSEQFQGRRQILAIGDARHQGADRFERRKTMNPAGNVARFGKHRRARFAKRLLQIGGQSLEETLEQQMRGIFETPMSRDLVQGAAPDHETAGAAIHFGKYRACGDDAFQAFGHNQIPFFNAVGIIPLVLDSSILINIINL